MGKKEREEGKRNNHAMKKKKKKAKILFLVGEKVTLSQNNNSLIGRTKKDNKTAFLSFFVVLVVTNNTNIFLFKPERRKITNSPSCHRRILRGFLPYLHSNNINITTKWFKITNNYMMLIRRSKICLCVALNFLRRGRPFKNKK